MTQVIEINDLDELSDFRLTWAALLPATRGASFFHSLDWLQTYWRHFGSVAGAAGCGQRLRVLIVYSGGSPIGILPLAVRSERTRAGSVNVLTYPLHDWASYYGPIGPYPTATLVAALRHLQATPQDWDLLDLRWTNKQEHDYGRTATAMTQAGFPPCEQVWATSAVTDFHGCWADYLATRDAKFRSNLRSAERKARAMGELTLERYRPRGFAEGDDEPRYELFDTCVELGRRSWQGASSVGTTLSHESIHPFLRETHELACYAGMLDVNVLRLDGRPVAFAYNYHFEGAIYGLRWGYDPAYAAISAGSLLMQFMLRDSFARGDRHLNLGSEYLDVKHRWSTRLVPSYRYTYYANHSWRAQLLRWKHWWAGSHRTELAV